MIKRILVPLDGSTLAETVLPMACSLASSLQATLVLFHVVEKKAPEEIHGQRHLRDASGARSYLEELARQFTCSGVISEVDVHEVQEAGVSQTIRHHADELHADLIILCAHGSGGLRDIFFGSIAQQVIRQNTVPVLFFKPNSDPESNSQTISHILLPLDGSDTHEGAIPLAVELALKCQAKIHLLTVVNTPESVPMKEALGRRVSPRAVTVSLEEAAQHAENYLQRIGKEISKQGIAVSGSVLRGDAPTKLLQAIHSEQIDLVILTTHGHNAADARWEGSLTPRFLPKTTVPVIVVKAEQEN
jgi:nucleotide-binding universal stress UspA family protein